MFEPLFRVCHFFFLVFALISVEASVEFQLKVKQREQCDWRAPLILAFTFTTCIFAEYTGREKHWVFCQIYEDSSPLPPFVTRLPRPPAQWALSFCVMCTCSACETLHTHKLTERKTVFWKKQCERVKHKWRTNYSKVFSVALLHIWLWEYKSRHLKYNKKKVIWCLFLSLVCRTFVSVSVEGKEKSLSTSRLSSAPERTKRLYWKAKCFLTDIINTKTETSFTLYSKYVFLI